MTSSFSKGDWVWIPSNKGSILTGAKVERKEGIKLQVVDDDKNKHVVAAKDCKKMNRSSVASVEDMITLDDTTESSILRNLHLRYKEKNIYTYTGSILASINPYMVLPIYTAEQIQSYKGRRFGELPPHVFAMGDNAYHNMQRYNKDQCIIISGESGSGKTENTKLLIQYLAAVSGQHSWIEQQILESNPVLEAFGNAKTLRNFNSSRFGKYINIQFDEQGYIVSANIQQYLLEKSRIVHQEPDERNYHIFYCMLAGMSKEEKTQLDLKAPSHYHYLSQGGCYTAEGRDDAKDFVNIRSALKVLMFTDDEIWFLLKIMSAVLHLGNVTYKETTANHTEAVVINDHKLLDSVATFFQVSKSQLKDALTSRTIVTRKEVLTQHINKAMALDIRDAFAKGVYGKLFIWIVGKINKTVTNTSKKDLGKCTSIGLLDIFGFENFGNSGFEQMCINFANEVLQQFFVKHVFQLEQEDYHAEGIKWTPVDYVDNKAILKLMVYDNLSIFSIIDEESIFPNFEEDEKGTDDSLLTKLHKNHSSNQHYVKPKSDTAKQFGIKHFAGQVVYNIKGYLEKNRDTFSQDLLTMLQTSKSAFIKGLFREDFNGMKLGQTQIVTVNNQFKKSLQHLMDVLEDCHPFFVRCIKPNSFKRPLEFDKELCAAQIQYSGMMETINIRRKGYPIRPLITDFVDRYSFIIGGIGPTKLESDCRSAAVKICKKLLQDEDYTIGRTKVFIKDGQDAFLEQQRDRQIRKKMVVIQKVIRGFIDRQKFKALKVPKKVEVKPVDKKESVSTKSGEKPEKHTLSEYIQTHTKPATTTTTSTKSDSGTVNNHTPTSGSSKPAVIEEPQDVWTHSPMPIDKPMLTKLHGADILSREACDCFLAVMKYCGDYPSKRTQLQLTQDVFEAPIKNEVLIDEIYCQLMKQLTDNGSKQSEDRGWELMWMATGLFAPSSNLLRETQKFIQSWHLHPLSDTCLRRINKTLSHGSKRKYPPHAVEVNAIQQKHTQLYYKIWFPDLTNKIFNVESNSRARDVCKDIVDYFKLYDEDCYSLYVEIANKTISIPKDDFVFDFGRHWTEKLVSSGMIKDAKNGEQPKLHFMRKLWMNVTPGNDTQADIKFHYPQAVYRYMKGYQRATKEQALFLGALLFKINHQNESKAPPMKTILKDLIPAHILKKVPTAEWDKKLSILTRNLGTVSPNEAKVNFLKTATKWETFGASYFEVKNTEGQEKVYLAISPKTVFMVDPLNKGTLAKHSLKDILYWSHGAKSFMMTIGNVMQSEKFIYTTSLGYKIDDLLDSYKELIGERREMNARTLHRTHRRPTSSIDSTLSSMSSGSVRSSFGSERGSMASIDSLTGSQSKGSVRNSSIAEVVIPTRPRSDSIESTNL